MDVNPTQPTIFRAAKQALVKLVPGAAGRGSKFSVLAVPSERLAALPDDPQNSKTGTRCVGIARLERWPKKGRYRDRK